MTGDEVVYRQILDRTISEAQKHEIDAQFETMTAGAILDELILHTATLNRADVKSYKQRHKKHLARAKYHVREIGKLEKIYNKVKKQLDAIGVDYNPLGI